MTDSAPNIDQTLVSVTYRFFEKPDGYYVVERRSTSLTSTEYGPIPYFLAMALRAELIELFRKQCEAALRANPETLARL